MQHFGGGMAFCPICGFAILGILVFAFWLWMLIDCLGKEFKGNEKIVWVLVIVLLNWIGALIYFIVGRDKAIRQDS
jgi:hypothetical protein